MSDEQKTAEDQANSKEPEAHTEAGAETVGTDAAAEQTSAEQTDAEKPADEEISGAGSDEGPGTDSVDLSDRESLAEQLQEQLDKAREDMLRAVAEAQNARRRAEQDVEKARKFALERFVQDLLPVVDNLERAMGSVSSDDEAIKPLLEGVELTYKSFQDSLARHQVKIVDPAGEPFDPEQHQAMSMVPNGEVEPNTVLEVFQKGYVLNGRLVRPAMVVVSKSPG